MSVQNNFQLSIAELTAAVRIAMIKLKYSSTTLCIYDCIWKDLIEYCSQRSITSFDIDVANDFAVNCYNQRIGDACKKGDDFRKKTVGRAMQHLLDYQGYGIIFQLSSRDNYQWHSRYKCAFNKYISEMIKKGYSKSTLITIKSEMASFQMFLLQRNVNYIAELTGSDIQSFILTFSKYAKSTIPKKMYYLRLLLQYMYQIGETADDLSLVCPHVKRGNYANSLPSVFSENEIIRILASIDKESPVGKRDYALLLAVIRLGLRASDIIRLRFCNIDWHNKNISVFQSKTHETVHLPLPEDVGWAIIDYLKNGRPQTECEYIFVKHAPVNGYYGEFETNPYSILQKYLSRANISSDHERRHGLHALRHSLASELLLKEIPLPVISGVLGHANTNTTGVYLKIDVNQLRKCALEV